MHAMQPSLSPRRPPQPPAAKAGVGTHLEPGVTAGPQVVVGLHVLSHTWVRYVARKHAGYRVDRYGRPVCSHAALWGHAGHKVRKQEPPGWHDSGSEAGFYAFQLLAMHARRWLSKQQGLSTSSNSALRARRTPGSGGPHARATTAMRVASHAAALPKPPVGGAPASSSWNTMNACTARM